MARFIPCRIPLWQSFSRILEKISLSLLNFDTPSWLDNIAWFFFIIIFPILTAELTSYRFLIKDLLVKSFLIRFLWIAVGTTIFHYVSIPLYGSRSPEEINIEQISLICIAGVQCLLVFLMIGGWYLLIGKKNRS